MHSNAPATIEGRSTQHHPAASQHDPAAAQLARREWVRAAVRQRAARPTHAREREAGKQPSALFKSSVTAQRTRDSEAGESEQGSSGRARSAEGLELM